MALLDINLCEIFDISRGIRYVLMHAICSLRKRDLYHIAIARNAVLYRVKHIVFLQENISHERLVSISLKYFCIALQNSDINSY